MVATRARAAGGESVVLALSAAAVVGLKTQLVHKQEIYDAMDNPFSSRDGIWRMALAAWERYPWFGIGMDNYSKLTYDHVRTWRAEAGKEFDRSRYVQHAHAHSLFVNALAERGSVGFAALARGTARVARGAHPAAAEPGDGDTQWLLWGAAASAWFVTVGVGLVNTTLHHEHGLLAALLLGLWLSTCRAHLESAHPGPATRQHRRPGLHDAVARGASRTAAARLAGRAGDHLQRRGAGRQPGAGRNLRLREAEAPQRQPAVALAHPAGTAVAPAATESRLRAGARARAASAEARAQPEARAGDRSPTSFSARLHEVERVFELGRSFGLHGTAASLQVFADSRKKSELQQQLGPGPFVAVHISARRPAQQWPLERYAALAAQLARQARVLLLWAPGSRDNPRHPGDDEAAAVWLRRPRPPRFRSPRRI
jgi:hypothetical protein